MEDFLDIILPPLLLLSFGVLVCAIVFWLALSRVMLWNARRRQLESTLRNTRQFTKEATSILIDIINDPSLDDGLRSKAISAYGKISEKEEPRS